jgi:arylsulfatase A-like enzyme
MPSRNLILISFDTLRFDAPSAAPDRRLLGEHAHLAQTPTLDRIVAEGAFFARGVTAAHRTSPSHASLLTGTYWPKHGILDLTGFRMLPQAETLAEKLRRHGYCTAQNAGSGRGRGIMFAVDSMGLNRGYDLEAFGGWIRWKTRRWLRRTVGLAPWFLFFHTMALHLPYGIGLRRVRRIARRDVVATPPCTELRQVYLRNVTNVDRRFGELWERLCAMGALDNTLVVITGDHGEGLSAHGAGHRETHGWEEGVCRVPMVFWCPGLVRAGLVTEQPVSSVDVAPTIAELLEIDHRPPLGFDGTSFASVARGEQPAAALRGRNCYFFGIMPGGLGTPPLMQGIVVGSSKYVTFAQASAAQWEQLKADCARDLMHPRRAWRYFGRRQLLQRYERGEWELLFDTSKDPAETENLARGTPARLDEFRRLMAEWYEHNRPQGASGPAQMMGSAEAKRIVKDLRALGYAD